MARVCELFYLETILAPYGTRLLAIKTNALDSYLAAAGSALLSIE